MADALSIKFDLTGLNGALDALKVKAQKAIRPAVQAGAQVYYDEVKLNVSRIGKVTGNLASSIYQVYSESQSTPNRATYHISWNVKKAPHGHLVEFGHFARYAVRLAPDGNWYTLVRPSMRGKPNPERKASQSEKDAYYLPRAGGPKQVGARPFVRPAFDKAQAALEAANARFVLEMKK